jgi:uncharacterized protein (TIGR02001 family)
MGQANQGQRWSVRVALLALALPARAQEPDGGGPAFSGTAALVSDYRFRGLSLSGRGPAVQGSLQVTTSRGFFAGAWGSSIADFNGATTEVDVYGGWTGPVGPLTATIGATGYLYPGGTGTSSAELYGSLAASAGPAQLTLGFAWAPAQPSLSASSRYLYGAASAGIPGTLLTLKAGLGHEQGGFVTDLSGRTSAKLDWLVGMDLVARSLTLGAALVGTNLPERDGVNAAGDTRLVLSLTAAF